MVLEVLHHEQGLVAVNKPAGLPTAGRTRDDPACVQGQLEAELGRPAWAVHQLDVGTTGVLLFVEKKSLVEPWAEALRRGSKTYLALVHGQVEFTTRVVDAPLARRGPLVEVDGAGSAASTHLTRLSVGPEASAVLARPRTGRTHQIRVHLAHLGFPLLGEDRYREPPSEVGERPFLHCWQIKLRRGEDEVLLEAPVPEDLAAAAEAAGLSLPAHPPALKKRRA